MKLSIIIPVYNEERTLAELLRKVKSVKVTGLRKEIIVVNDCSTDRTENILQMVKGIRIFKHHKNRGKGAAVRTGFSKALGEIVIIQDADLEYDPTDYARLVRPILERRASVVYGSRLKKYPLVLFGKEATPLPAHLIANKFLTFVTNILYGGGLTDMETCYKVFSREALRSIKLVSNGFEIEPEITAKLLKKGYKIKEISIKVKPRNYDEGKKISWKDGIKAIYYLLYWRFIE